MTRDFSKRYLYAVDARQGSLMLYDITDPVNGPRNPLTRPNPELDPLQAPDRILLSAPVATVTFARHDFPLPNQTQTGPAATGLLCNPNTNAGDVTNGRTPVDPRSILPGTTGLITVPLGPDAPPRRVRLRDDDEWAGRCHRRG